MRDPRDVVMSERRMRIGMYNSTRVKQMPVDDFVRWRFEARLRVCVCYLITLHFSGCGF